MKIGRRYKEQAKNKIKILFIIILIITLTVIAVEVYRKNKKDDNVLIQDIANDNSEVAQTDVKTERMTKLEALQTENSDIVAWLEIEGTNINYPVLQGEDNEFYMTHTYNKEYSKDGSLFLDKDYNWELPSTNLLIYGHNNIGSKEMFVSLLKYEDENFYKEHPIIRLTTNKEDAEYEIIAVFKSRVYYKSETGVFRYYYFINAENEQEFNEFIQNSKEASLYNIEATAEYGDQLLTLSTCSYHTEDRKICSSSKKNIKLIKLREKGDRPLFPSIVKILIQMLTKQINLWYNIQVEKYAHIVSV